MHEQDITQQLDVIRRGAVEIISEDDLKEKLKLSLKENRPLKVKAGFDPTAPDIHIGHTVLLRKLRQFQDLGHEVIFLIGDFTGMIGDPTGQDKLRKRLTEEEVLKNAATYKKQVFKILDEKRTKVVFNSAWLKKMTSSQILDLASHVTLAQLLVRQDFNQRYTSGKDISLLEFFYPLLQAYDSVYLEADVEIGGSDQKFNLLLGRELQRDFKQSAQIIITMPLLEGTDGVKKMSKSYGNYIGIDETPQDMFGKVMSIPDETMLKYYTLLTSENLDEVKSLHPKEAKLRLAQQITSCYYGPEKAKEAREGFENIFSQRQLPQDCPVFVLGKNGENIVEVLVKNGLVTSKNEARRLIKQGGVSLEGKLIDSENTTIDKEGVLKVGKKRFLKIEIS